MKHLGSLRFLGPMAVVLLIFLLTGTRTEAGEADNWLRLESDNFTLISNADDAIVRTVGANLERLHDVLTQMTGAPLTSPVPTMIYVFRDDASYTPYKLYRRGRRVEVLGYLMPHEHGTYAALNGHPGVDPSRYVYKQYIHHLLQDHLPHLPLWLRQGVAEYYSSFQADATEARLGLPIREHILQLRQSQLIPLSSLLVVDQPLAPTAAPGAPKKIVKYEELGAENVFYTQSWALVHYLLIGNPEYRDRMPAFLNALRRGTEPMLAFRQSFKVEPRALEGQLKAYLRQEEFSYARIPVRGDTEVAIETFAMAQPEVHFRLGDLLLHGGKERLDKAAEQFRLALELDDKHGQSWTGLGYISELRGEHDAARAHYEKAVAHAPDEFLSQYLHGQSLLRQLAGRRPAGDEELALVHQARDAFKRCVELREKFAPAWERLGYAHGLDPRPSAEGVAALETAMRLLPGRSDVVLNLLLAHARGGNRDSAEGLYLRLETLRADPTTLGQARDILLQMDFQEANRLIRNNQLDDAVALYARVQAETSNENLRQQVTEFLKTVTQVDRHNQFVEAYTQVVQLLQARDLEGASSAVAEMAEAARPGRQAEAVAALEARVAKIRSTSTDDKNGAAIAY